MARRNASRHAGFSLIELMIAQTFNCTPFESQDGVDEPAQRSCPFFLRYRDDAATWTLRFPGDETNRATAAGGAPVTLGVFARDMTGNGGDADPATVAHWSDGAWAGFEDEQGSSTTDTGEAYARRRSP